MAPRPQTSHGLLAVRLVAVSALLALASCASVEFERTTETSGTFKSVGWAHSVFPLRNGCYFSRSNTKPL